MTNNIYPSLVYFQKAVCLFKLNEFEKVQYLINDNLNLQFPLGERIYHDKKSYFVAESYSTVPTASAYYTDIQTAKTIVGGLNNLANANQQKMNEIAQRRAENAQMWGNILTGVATGVLQAATTKTTSSTTSRPLSGQTVNTSNVNSKAASQPSSSNSNAKLLAEWKDKQDNAQRHYQAAAKEYSRDPNPLTKKNLNDCADMLRICEEDVAKYQ